MGQKVHPQGFRLGVIESWDSKWFARRDYRELLHEDLKLRKFLKKRLYHAGISKIEIERAANKAKINIYTARPGIVIGKKGAEIEKLKSELGKLTRQGDVHQHPRGAPARPRRAAGRRERRAAARAPRRLPPRHEGSGRAARMRMGAQGIRIQCAGRLGGAEIARSRVVPRGPRAAAHAARRHQLRLRRGEDDLRRDRREGVDLPRRGPHAARTRSSSSAPSASERVRITACSHRRRSSTASCRRAAAAARRGAAATLAFGDYGLQALDRGWLTARQIEAARVALTRHIKRGGRVWIRVFPDKPLTQEAGRDPHGQGQGQRRRSGWR